MATLNAPPSSFIERSTIADGQFDYLIFISKIDRLERDGSLGNLEAVLFGARINLGVDRLKSIFGKRKRAAVRVFLMIC
jgi:hypothetical protein